MPHLAEAWLHAVDAALNDMGAARGVGDECKSVARLICPDADLENLAGWDTQYIQNTCRVLAASEPVQVLGSFAGPPDSPNTGLRKALARTEQARAGIAS